MQENHKEVTEPKAFSTKLKEAYYGIPYMEMTTYRDRIIEECGITKAVFWNYLNGVTVPPKLNKEKIAAILKKSVEVLFPEGEEGGQDA